MMPGCSLHVFESPSSQGVRSILFALALTSAVVAVEIGLSLTSIRGAFAQTQYADTVRPEVGNPLLAAQELIKTQKYRAALAKIQEAEGVKDKTAYEQYMIDRLRANAAAGSGEVELAVKSFESVMASSRTSPSEKLKMTEAAADLYYRSKDYSKAISWALRYRDAGGTAEEMRRLLVQAYYLNGDFGKAAQEVRSMVQADESAGRTPSEERLQLLASCYLKQQDMAGYSAALEKLVASYPKNEYWRDLVYRIESRPGFSPRLALDVYRLKMAVGVPSTSTQIMEMTQLALQAGFPLEAKKIIDKGFAAGVLGSGPDADRQKRLRDLATKSASEDQKALGQRQDESAAAAKDGTALVNAGFAYVTRGDYGKGADLIQQGIRKGGLKHPDDAQLHLGIAYLLGGQKEQAIRVFKSVQGTDGAADLARLWAIYARQPA